MTRHFHSRTVMLVATLAGAVALGANVRTAPQGHHPIVGALCPAPDDTLVDVVGNPVWCVMTALDSPRGLAFGPEGALYVVEAGSGAGVGVITTPATDPRCFLTNIGSRQCYGTTGAVTRLWRDTQERIVTGLPSTSFPKGPRGLGAADIGFNGRGDAYVTIGWENDPTARFTNPLLPDLPQFANLIHVSASGNWRSVADLGAFEADANPDR